MMRLLAISVFFTIGQVTIIHDCVCARILRPQDEGCCKHRKEAAPPLQDCQCTHITPTDSDTPEAPAVTPTAAVTSPDAPYELPVAAQDSVEGLAAGPPVEMCLLSYPLRR